MKKKKVLKIEKKIKLNIIISKEISMEMNILKKSHLLRKIGKRKQKQERVKLLKEEIKI